MEDDTKDLLNNCSSLIIRLNDRIHKLESFASDIVHEFKNPLTSIKMSVDLLSNENLSDEERKDLYNSINDELNHMDILLKDIRDVSKNEISDIDKNKEKISIVSITENVIRHVKSYYKDVTFELESRDISLDYYIEPEKLVCVLENLIDNAASFAAKSVEKSVIVSIDIILQNNYDEKNPWFEVGDNFMISVQDSGIGIPEKERRIIFNRFYTKREDNERENHSGLGLSIVQMMVETLKGGVTVGKSDKLGGARFSIFLPINQTNLNIRELKNTGYYQKEIN